MNIVPETTQDAISQGTAGAVQATVRFLRVVRQRLHYVVASVVVAGLFGALYYGTATRIYEGKSTLLVNRTGADVWNASMSAEGSRHGGLMPTCERLVTSAVVLDEALRRIAALPPDLRIDFASKPQNEWAELLERNLSARALRQTNLIEVSYRSKSPQAARAVVDAVNTSYLAFMDKNHRDASVEIVAVLDNARQEIEQNLLNKQQQLLEVKKRTRDLGLRQGSTVVHPTVQRVVMLNDAMVEAQKHRLHLEVSLASLRSAVEQRSNLHSHLINLEPVVGQQAIIHALGLSPEVSRSVHEIERRLIDNRAELQVLQAHYGPRHPKVVQVQSTILNAEELLAHTERQAENPLAKLSNERLGPILISVLEARLQEAHAREKQLREEFVTVEDEAVKMNDQLAELQIVEDELQRLRGFHKSLLDKITTIDVSQNRADVQLSIVSEPEASEKPVSPKLALVALLCVFLGVGGGVGAVYVLDQLDDRFRSPEEMEQQLGVPLLAMVRRLPAMEGSGAAAVQVHANPQAVESEAFRTLRTTLAFAGYSRVAITSAEPGDGKTTVLINLAAALAQANKRTLLIDGDLRRPGMSQLFGLRGVEGLSQLLRSEKHISENGRACIHASGIANLDILPAGSRLTDPGELLGSPRMAEFVAWAEGNYDQVLIDCPPIMAASDAAILGRQCDGIILVVQPGKNHRRVVVRTVDELARMKSNVVGVVVNCADETDNPEYYGYGAGYGYGYGDDAEDEPTDRRQAA